MFGLFRDKLFHLVYGVCEHGDHVVPYVPRDNDCQEIITHRKLSFSHLHDDVHDAGPLDGGAGSTVVDVSGAEPLVLREGKITAARILDALRRT